MMNEVGVLLYIPDVLFTRPEVLEPITEVTAAELLKQDDPNFLRKFVRVKQIQAKFVGFRSRAILKFVTNSGSGSGSYVQLIKIKGVDKFWKDFSKKPFQRVRQALKVGEVQVSCTCPSFGFWGFRYILSRVDKLAAQGRREFRRPDVRNPGRKGTTCKHLYRVLQVLPFNAGKITKEGKRLGFIKEDSEGV